MASIYEIAEAINNSVLGTPLEDFQALRKELKGLKKVPSRKIFTPQSIFTGRDIYAFHLGGRKEAQFNIGFERGLFRFGVAFSLEPSQSLPDLSILTPSIERYNLYLRHHPEDFRSYSAWYYQNGNHYPCDKEFPDRLIGKECFFFLGHSFSKDSLPPLSELAAAVATTFAELLPLYVFCESEVIDPPVIQKLGNKRHQPKRNTLDLGELRKLADTLTDTGNRKKQAVRTLQYQRAPILKILAKDRAKGVCEGCLSTAPFTTNIGDPFLEVHHIVPLSEGGQDIRQNVVALCPNCHRRAHHSGDKRSFSDQLKRNISALEK